MILAIVPVLFYFSNSKKVFGLIIATTLIFGFILYHKNPKFSLWIDAYVQDTLSKPEPKRFRTGKNRKYPLLTRIDKKGKLV